MKQSPQLSEIWLARHGETAWTITHQHTGRTDIPLTERGERNAVSLGERIRGMTFTGVFFSPLERARRTADLAGFGSVGQVDPDLLEWDYGEYDGLRTEEICQRQPGWSLFRDGCPGGESVAEVGARADRVTARLRPVAGRVLLFGHAHFFRVLAARWLGLPPSAASLFFLGTASLSILGYEHSADEPAIRLWNDDRHVTP
ncbi:MAG TPA: histidine phosphatase family protein [Isosphaeraceae bacterium]|nr:histidine phosphatase family protein [Isosphaeraceae bacterium]